MISSLSSSSIHVPFDWGIAPIPDVKSPTPLAELRYARGIFARLHVPVLDRFPILAAFLELDNPEVSSEAKRMINETHMLHLAQIHPEARPICAAYSVSFLEKVRVRGTRRRRMPPCAFRLIPGAWIDPARVNDIEIEFHG